MAIEILDLPINCQAPEFNFLTLPLMIEAHLGAFTRSHASDIPIGLNMSVLGRIQWPVFMEFVTNHHFGL